jgi:hypothetical protein
MQTAMIESSSAMALQSQAIMRWCRSWRFWLLAALALQYAVFQLATSVEYMDAPRNLHWGIYLLEQPRFLLNAEDVYDRINGYPPSLAALAPAGAAVGRSTPLHPWWGPLYLGLFGSVWWLTGSYTALRLVVPLAAGATVLLTYAFGARYFNRRVGLLAAVLLALFPVYREHGSLSFVEPLSALLISGALWAFLARRTALAALLGALVVLGKIDMILLYFGTVVITALAYPRTSGDRFTIRHVVVCLVAPTLVLLPWIYLTYVINARPTTVGGGPSLYIFRIIAPLMLDQVFTLKPFITLLTLALIGMVAGWSLWLRKGAQPLVYRLLAAWLALGCAVALVYTATPGASNNPRVFIPALPALCLLVADGLDRIRPQLRKLTLGYVLVIFTLVNVVGIWYQVLQSHASNAMMPVWEALRSAPRGAVLTQDYWDAALYARQPATWFAQDEAFQHNILYDLEHFRSYIATAPIRYIVLPRDQQAGPAYTHTSAVRLYDSLPIGRELGWAQPPLTAPAVRTFLEQRFPKQSTGDFVIFTLDR